MYRFPFLHFLFLFPFVFSNSATHSIYHPSSFPHTQSSIANPLTPYPSYESSPQAWLDSLPFPSSLTTRVALKTLASDPAYVRKLYIRVEKLGVIPPARVAREVVTPSVSKTAEEENPRVEAWLEEEYSPHLSLL